MRDDDVQVFQRQLKRLYRRIQRENPSMDGLSNTALQMLVTLDRAGTPLRPSELAEKMEMKTSNVAATLRTLEAQQLIERQSDPTDGRKAHISVSEHGHGVLTEIRRGRRAWLQGAITTTLSDDEQDLLRRAGELMDRIAEA